MNKITIQLSLTDPGTHFLQESGPLRTQHLCGWNVISFLTSLKHAVILRTIV